METKKCCGCGTPESCSSTSCSSTDWKKYNAWLRRYIATMAILMSAWWLIYTHIQAGTGWLVFKVLGFAQDSHLGTALEFFLYDSVKILLLLVALIYCIAWIRASLNVERVRDFLTGRKRGIGYVLGAMFGAVTPFCSCSSVPLFLGFSSAGIPVGITMAFLITSPLVNEIAVVLLWSLLGWKCMVAYVLIGLGAGILDGFFMDSIRAGRWFQPLVLEAMKMSMSVSVQRNTKYSGLSVQQRHLFAYGELSTIFRRVWKWVIIGVGIGALLHGLVPADWFAEHFSAGQWWTVPVAVLVGIPLYSNVTGIIPVMESLLLKGMPVGTTMAFCMSAVAASIPEVIMLRQVMSTKLQAVFLGYLWVMFTLSGWLLNVLQGTLL